MRTLRLIPCLILMLWLVTSVYAVPFDQGVYEVEDCGGDCTLSGTWSIFADGSQEWITSTSAGDYVEFEAQGKHLVIWRYFEGGMATFDICVNASCQSFAPSSGTDYRNQPILRALTGGVDTIRITLTSSDPLYLDNFMILDAPGGGSFPTPVPTATVVPTSTPAPTATPASTTTPQPSHQSPQSALSLAHSWCYLFHYNVALLHHLALSKCCEDHLYWTGADGSLKCL